MDYHIVVVRTSNEAAEILSSTIDEINGKGIEFTPVDEKKCDYYDLVDMKIFFSIEESLDEKITFLENQLKDISKISDIGEFTIKTLILDNDDWMHNWKKYYKSFHVNEKIVIKPSWEDYQKKNPDEVLVEIDPGTVFGSGTHETTSMCIQLLDEFVKDEDQLIDVGCGTGVLGITAAKLGVKDVMCIDIDKECVKVTEENARLNQLEETIRVKHGNLIENVDEKADIVVANILSEVIVILLDDIPKVLKKEGIFIASGIIGDKQKRVEEKLLACNFELIKVLSKGEWIGIASRYKGAK